MYMALANEIKIGYRIISNKTPCFIIAEAGSNHNGDMKLARRLIDMAKIAGCDAVKFQHHLPDEEMLRNVPKSNAFEKESLYDVLKRVSLTISQHRDLKKYCDKKKILYLCTPFSLKAAQEINKLVPAFKIGSGELTDIPTLREIAKEGKPIILSTGMSTLDEIKDTVDIIRLFNNQIILLHCVSEYPTKYEDINLGVIPRLQEICPIVGFSDHTKTLYTSFASISLGAKVIEKHIIIDRLQGFPDASVSLEPKELCELVEGIRNIEKAMGSERKVYYAEEDIQRWARRSIVSIRDIKKGEKFTIKNIWGKRPGTGIPTKEISKVLGKTAKLNIKKDKLIRRGWIK